MPINFEPFIHPLDRQALSALQKIPLLDTALRKFMKEVPENMLHGIKMASMIRLNRKQLPRIYEMLLEICAYLDIPEPELYLEMNPMNVNKYKTPNAIATTIANLRMPKTIAWISVFLDLTQEKSILSFNWNNDKCQNCFMVLLSCLCYLVTDDF